MRLLNRRTLRFITALVFLGSALLGGACLLTMIAYTNLAATLPPMGSMDRMCFLLGPGIDAVRLYHVADYQGSEYAVTYQAEYGGEERVVLTTRTATLTDLQCGSDGLTVIGEAVVGGGASAPLEQHFTLEELHTARYVCTSTECRPGSTISSWQYQIVCCVPVGLLLLIGLGILVFPLTGRKLVVS